MIIPLLALTLAAQAPDPGTPVRDYPLQSSFDYAESDRVTALCLVDCIAPGRADTRRYEYPDPISGVLLGDTDGTLRRIWIETVRVVDSTALPQGTTAQVVIAGTPTLVPTSHMRPGGRYLVLAALPKGKRLETPHSGTFGTGTDTAVAMSGEVSGLAAFSTRAGALDRSATAADRIANSVVDCIPGSDAPGIKRVADWLRANRYPNAGPYRSDFGQESFPLSEKIARFTLTQPAYHRYKLFQALCQWGVYGSEQKWVNAIVDLAGETTPFLPGDTNTGGELTFSQARASTGYVAVRIDDNQWADTILGAKNDAVRILLLEEVPRRPDDAHLTRMAQALLASTHEGLLRSLVLYLADLLKRPELEPRYRRGTDGGGWINRDESLGFLKKLYGVDTRESR